MNQQITMCSKARLRNIGACAPSFTRWVPQTAALIQFRLLLLIATPSARVAFSLVGFVLERDGIYVVIASIVLAVLIYSIAGEH